MAIAFNLIRAGILLLASAVAAAQQVVPAPAPARPVAAQPQAAPAAAQHQSAPAPAQQYYSPPAAPELTPEAAARLARSDELMFAVAKADARRVAAWIQANKDVNFNFDEVTRGRSSESPLTMALNRDHVEIVRLLLEAGADPSRQDGFGRPPIHLAKSAETTRLLLQRGVDVNILDRTGRTALTHVVERGDLQSVDRLVAGGARLDVPLKGSDLLTRAVETKHPGMAAALLERGLDPRKPPTQALWPLIERGDTATAVLLIRRGADVNAADSRGDTLLTRALFRQRWEIVEALADAGANLRPPDAPNCRHGSYSCQSIQPARLATFNPATLQKLRAKGLNVNIVASDGHTALTSIISDTPMAVRAVSPAGAVAGVAQNAVTGEVVVSSSPRKETVTEIPAPDNAARVQVLLDARADPNLKYRNATPLMLAIALHNKPPAMIDALIRAGGRIESEAVFVFVDNFRPTVAASTSASEELGGRTIAVGQSIVTGMSVGPLTWALFHGRPDVALRLLERDKQVTRADRHLLYFAATTRDWDVLMRALPHTREVNAGNRADVTPLMMAADAGRADVVKALLAAGANVNVRSARIWPPPGEPDFQMPSLAALSGHGHSRLPLVGGYTALRAANERGHAEVVKILREAGGRE